MPTQLFPKEILERTTEYHLSRYPSSTQVVYITILMALLAAIAILPLVNVDVSVKSQGLLKATTEVSAIKAPATGIVNEIFIKENEAVQKGQLLFSVQSPVLAEKDRFLQSKVDEVNGFLRDLKLLIDGDKAIAGRSIVDGHNNNRLLAIRPSTTQLSTSLYRQSLSDYQQRLLDRKTRLTKVSLDYDRNKKLYDQKVIAAVDFENFEFEHNKAKIEIELLKQSQLSQWQQDRRNYEKEITELQNQLAQVQKETEQMQIKAPVSGTVQNLAGVYIGSTLFSGQELAQISPNTGLQAEVYVSPNDIGLLREGMDVRMQVGAFHYNQWGLLHGKVKEISNDIQVVNNQPLFEVKCTLDKDHLTLKNGYQGKVKKGMTLQARFVVTQRSLWQLLYDKVDDWVNPNIVNSKSAHGR